MLGDRLYVTPHSTLHVFQTLLPSIFPLLLTIVLQFLPSFFSYLFPVIPPFTFPFCAIALHFPPAVNDCPSVSFTALLTAHFTLFTLFALYPLHRSPNHLQLQSFLSITSHPLANSLVPNPNERGTPLSFGVPPFSSVFHLLWTIFLHCLLFFSYLFPRIPPVSSIFPLFSTIFLRFFPTFFLSCLNFPPFPPVFNDLPSFSVVCFLLFSWHSSIFPHFPPFPPCFERFSFIPPALEDFPSLSIVFFLPFSLHSSNFLHFPPVFNDFPSFFSYLFPVIPPFTFLFCRFFPTFFLAFPHIPPFSSISSCFQRFSFVFSSLFPVMP